MTAPETLLACYGTMEPAPEPRVLTAGALSAELIGGNLRNIRFNGREVLRAISYVVRDKDWGTYAPEIGALDIEETAAGFALRFEAHCGGATGEMLAYRVAIAGNRAGQLTFTADATPQTDFLTNRCGFTILHPIVGVAGEPVEVEHVDGTVERSTFPLLIDPAQPFMAMRAITHQVAAGVRATCRMEGDAFEMEDQRNWSDASYKTYVRPLALPWPYLMPAGVTDRQSVTLTIEAAEGAAAVAAADPLVRVALGAPAGTLGRFGLVLSPEEAAATLRHGDRLAELAPQTLLCHFDPTAGHGAAAMDAFAAVARLHPTEVVLECVVPCAAPLDEELGEIAQRVQAAGLALDAVAVSPAVDRRSTPPGSVWPDCPPLEAVYDAALRAFPGVRLGGGTFSYFTELNRKRPPADRLDFVTHCTCPLVHDADDRSVMQSLEALPFILASTRAIIGADTPYRIGPSTIGMRHNPYGSRTAPNPDARRMTMTPQDPRQRGLFAAAWMVGYAARLAEAGVEAFTGAALTGDFGLIERDGTPRPAFHAARWLAALAGTRRVPCRSSREDAVLALAAEPPDGRRVMLLANLTDIPQTVTLEAGRNVTMLDETVFATGRLSREPCTRALVLRPYAVARIQM